MMGVSRYVSMYIRQLWVRGNLRADTEQVSGAGVIELMDDDPAALEAMLQYIYTSQLPVKATMMGNFAQPRHWLEVLYVSDKYGLTDLTNEIYKLLESSSMPQPGKWNSTSHFSFIDRAAEIPGGGARMENIVFRLCNREFRTHFQGSIYREWLDGHADLQDRLYKEHI